MKLLAARFALSLTVAALTACTATLSTPYVAYVDKQRPLSETAVLIVYDNRGDSNPVKGQVEKVDGEAVSCDAMTGCPWWVRVTSGSHSFEINYKFDMGMGYVPATISYKYAKLQLAIPEMKARHTYMAQFSRNGDMVHVDYVDLGKDSSAGVRPCGTQGDCKTVIPAKFE